MQLQQNRYLALKRNSKQIIHSAGEGSRDGGGGGGLLF